MGLQRWLRRRRWAVLAWVCFGVIGLQLFLFRTDSQRDTDDGTERENHVHVPIETGAKRKRLQALPDNDVKYSSRDIFSGPIISPVAQIKQGAQKRSVTITRQDKDEIKPQKPLFKIFVYDLPDRFNSNITRCVQQADDCYHFDHHGTGPELRQSDHITYRNTHQHSLEVILHQKILQSEYRTLKLEEADAFYIPFYPALACACKSNEDIDLKQLHSDLWSHLSDRPYFSKGGRPLRPHFMTLGTIEREHWSSNCPLLRDADRTNGITFIGVEKELNNAIRKYFKGEGKQIIVAPYPSFGHFDSSYTKALVDGKRPVFPEDISQTTRDIRIFMATSSRKAHDIRVILKHQMNGTSQRYSAFTSIASKQQKTAVWFNTPKCSKNIQLPIIDWMRHSVFCLQPPGNSPTRKSFYDAVMSGCIPVTFKPRKGTVIYPFQSEMDYGSFTFNIPLDDVLSGKVRVIERLKDIPNYRIKELQNRLVQAAPHLQYSYPPVEFDSDAFSMIINEIKKIAA